MPEITQAIIMEWVQRLFSLKQRYYDLIDAGIQQRLAAPASEQEIIAFETSTGIKIPPSYRLFISLHNGWYHWAGDLHILSLEEQQRGPYADLIRERKTEAWEEGEPLLLDGLVIGASLDSYGALVIDTSRRDEWDEMEVVRWEHGEIGRYTNFLELLQRSVDDWEQLVADEISETTQDESATNE